MHRLTLLILLFAGAAGSVFAREKKAGYSAEIPFVFYKNNGQVADQDGRPRTDIDYRITNGSVTMFVGKGQLHYQFNKALDNGRYETHRVDVKLEGANANAQAIGENKQAGSGLLFLGSSKSFSTEGWNKVVYRNIYPNIDWVLYTKGNELEYDFVVHPGANVSNIQMQYKGAEAKLAQNGSLVLTSELGTITEHAPVSFEKATGRAVASKFVVKNSKVSFECANYTGALVIDPTLLWATYYGGGSTDQVNGLCADANGNIYLAGQTQSNSNIATAGAYKTTISGTINAFLAKFDSNGVRQWGTYFGINTEKGQAVICDAAGDVYFTGSTNSTGIATTGAYQTTFGGGLSDVFLAKFTSAGALVWNTYMGGTGTDLGYALACDGTNIYLSGHTTSTTGIATTGAYQAAYGGGSANDAFLAKFNQSGVIQWSTYFGGTAADMGYGVACDANKVYLAGMTQSSTGIATAGAYQSSFTGTRNAYLASFNNTGTINWASYFGNNSEYGYSVSNDPNGNLYLVGYTTATGSTGLSTTGAHQPVYGGGARDAYLAKFNAAGTLKWSTYYGGTGDEYGFSVSCKGDKLCIAGASTSTNGIATGNGQQTAPTGQDAYVAVFDTLGVRSWGSYFGGPGNEFGWAVTNFPTGGFVIGGYTPAATNIATTGAFQTASGGGTDGFLARYSPANNCSVPTALNVTPGAPGSVSIDWTENGGSTQWDVEYGPDGMIPGTGTHVLATAHPLTVSGLQTNGNSYHFYVRAICGVGDTSMRVGPATYTYPQTATTASPYTEGWEIGTDGWTILNSTQTNRWVRGTAVNNGGTYSLYVSDNAANTNNYNLAVTSTVHAFRDITFPTGSYPQITLSFDWRNIGEGSVPGNVYDRLRVWLVPTTYNPAPGTEIGPGNQLPVPVTGAVQLGLASYAAQASFATVTANIPASYAGTTARLVFEWHNDNGGGAQPPAAVDNINITMSSCLTTLPYNEGFEGTTGTSLPPCASVTTMVSTATTSSYDYGSFGARSGNRYMVTQNNSSVNNSGTYYTPPLQLTANTTYQISAWVNMIGPSYTRYYRYGAVTVAYGTQPIASAMTNVIANVPRFTTGDIATGNATAYKQLYYNFTPTTTGVYYLSIGLAPNASQVYNMSLDDISVRVAPTCIQPDSLGTTVITDTSATLRWRENGSAATWQVQYGATGFTLGNGTVANSSTNPKTINGLAPATQYEFYVRSACGANDTSLWYGPFRFKTICTPQLVAFTEGFESANTCSYTFNADQNQFTWKKDVLSHTGDSMLITVESINTDDWYYTSPVYLNAGTEYQLSFWYRAASSASYPQAQGLNVYMGGAGSKNAFFNSTANKIQTVLNTVAPIYSDPAITPAPLYIKVRKSFTPATSGIYYVAFHDTASTFGGRIFLDDIRLTIADIQTSSIVHPATDTICADPAVPLDVALHNNGLSHSTDSVFLTATYTVGSTTQTLSTVFTDTLFAGGADTASFGTMDMSTPGTYTIKVHLDHIAGDTSIHNDTLTKILVVLDTPSATGITATNTLNTFSFSANGAQYAVTYNWDFGDGSAHDGQSAPSHAYTHDGVYTVTLIISNLCGSDTITRTITAASGIVNINIGEKDLFLYPNPAQDEVSLYNKTGVNIAALRVYDEKGSMVLSMAGSNATTQKIITASWSTGVYQVQIITKEGIVTRRFVVQR